MVFLAFPLSLFFFLIVAPFWVSLSTPIMNSNSDSNGENSETRHTSPYSCLYCKKVFSNHRALGGHLKTHNIEIKSRWRRQPRDCSGISIGLPISNTNPLYNNQSKNSSGGAGNNCPFSNKGISMHATMAPSGSTAAAGVPLDPSLSLGLPRVCQSTTSDDQTPGDGLPFFYRDGFWNLDHNLSKPSFPVSKPHSSLDLNQLPGFKETTAVGSFVTDPCPCLGHDESDPNKMKSFLSCEDGKRQLSLDSLGDTEQVKALKRPKFVSNLPMETEKIQSKKPLLVKDVEEPYPGFGISIGAGQEVLAGLDLSLHL